MTPSSRGFSGVFMSSGLMKPPIPCTMLVSVDGREYTVVVPDGVSKGQPFRFEVQVAAVPLAAAAAVPVGSSGAAATAAAAAAAPRSAFGAAMGDAKAAVSAARTTQQVAKDLGVVRVRVSRVS